MSKVKRSSLVLTHWRREWQKCKRCKSTICHCSTWCKCSAEAVALFYESIWINSESRAQDWETLDLILSSIYDINIRWPLLREELERLPVHIPHDEWVYSEETIKWINNYLDAFAIKLKCEDCIEHYKSREPFKWTKPIDLWRYINNLHNRVNKLNAKREFPFNKFMEKVWLNAKQKKLINWWDIYLSNRDINLPLDK